MRITLLSNPDSGRGRATGAALEFAERLAGLGHAVEVADIRPRVHGGEGAAWLVGKVRGADGVVIVGGDGTVHHTVRDLIAGWPGDDPAGPPPVYQLPLGTENLFARQFGMTADASRVHEALERGSVERVDLGWCNGWPFVLLCSVGFDANVVHRLHGGEGGRRGPIRRHSYLGPIAAEVMEFRPRPLTVVADGETLASRRCGMVVVANSREYARRLNPASDASMTDGLLDVVILGFETRRRFAAWWVATRLRRQARMSGFIQRRARRVEITGEGPPLRYQMDGEPFACGAPVLSIGVGAGALRVLAPAGALRCARGGS